jgi:hypothetical protein
VLTARCIRIAATADKKQPENSGCFFCLHLNPEKPAGFASGGAARTPHNACLLG